ncbi:MAG TPA: GNAT family N-acetyltransferase [Allosphingosinicella sp.]|nr:GNAT family N-acetyltransferase [Allosphingosinicella sp.]
MLKGGAIPVLETERLLLRAHRAEDFAAHSAMLADEKVTRYVGGKPVSPEEAWRKLIGAAGVWTLLGYGYWSVERKEDGLYIGQVGFADFKRDMEPSIAGLPEMGWLFASHAHGRGYASEAVAAGLAWADEALKGQEVVAIINPNNASSIKVAEKAGFARREEAIYKGESILLFRRPARSS